MDTHGCRESPPGHPAVAERLRLVAPLLAPASFARRWTLAGTGGSPPGPPAVAVLSARRGATRHSSPRTRLRRRTLDSRGCPSRSDSDSSLRSSHPPRLPDLGLSRVPGGDPPDPPVAPLPEDGHTDLGHSRVPGGDPPDPPVAPLPEDGDTVLGLCRVPGGLPHPRTTPPSLRSSARRGETPSRCCASQRDSDIGQLSLRLLALLAVLGPFLLHL